MPFLVAEKSEKILISRMLILPGSVGGWLVFFGTWRMLQFHRKRQILFGRSTAGCGCQVNRGWLDLHPGALRNVEENGSNIRVAVIVDGDSLRSLLLLEPCSAVVHMKQSLIADAGKIATHHFQGAGRTGRWLVYFDCDLKSGI